MSVNPGFGGQKFIQRTYHKVQQLRELINQSGGTTLIEIDGGVNNINAERLINAGADVLVVGSFVFKAEDPLSTISELKKVPA
jgi:ribulose-phosphate 3-epimerase